jgi:ribosomal protein L6, bacterial type
MSRIGKKPIQVPAKVKVEIKGAEIKAVGPLGTLSYTLPQGISAKLEGAVLTLALGKGLEDEMNAVYGTTRARLANVINGVETAFKKTLEINGLGYKAIVNGKKLNLELGFSHPVILDIPEGITVTADLKSPIVEIKGIDKVLVGDFAAQIRRIRPPEPYKGSGIKYQGEHIIRKAGKAAAAGGGK